MQHKALRNLLKKDQKSIETIRILCGQLDVSIHISNDVGKTLWGAPSDDHIHHFDLHHDHIRLGAVSSNKTEASIIADLVNLLITKEVEKKRIGAEVLGLYREINMIYEFSEKIASKIDSVGIAETAIYEASQIIPCAGGFFLIHTESEHKGFYQGSFGIMDDWFPLNASCSKLIEGYISDGNSLIFDKRQLKDLPAEPAIDSLMIAPLKNKNKSWGILVLSRDNGLEFKAAELKLLTTIAVQSAAAIESAFLYQKGLREAKEREEAIRKIHDVSTKFVPYEFINSLGKKVLTEVSLGDQVARNVTVLFADIRDFTTLSESMAPEENFLFINGFNERMGPIVRKHHGFINQYLGDGFMAIFPEKPQDAIRASVEMFRTLEAYNQERMARNRQPISMGIGMQNGELIMGITGDVQRMDAATISDTVNTAARIEGLSKHYGTNILLTEDCLSDLDSPDEFDFRYLGPVQVKGKTQTLDLYECINGDSKELYKHKLDTLAQFEKGMEQYFQKEFAMAALTFQSILKQDLRDRTAKLFLNRSANLITKELDEGWKGVESMRLK